MKGKPSGAPTHPRPSRRGSPNPSGSGGRGSRDIGPDRDVGP